MTFANDHCVTIIPNLAQVSPDFNNVLNDDHVRMLHALRRRLKKIMSGHTSIPKSKVNDMAATWEIQHETASAAALAYESIEPFIRLLIGIQPALGSTDTGHDTNISMVTWQQIVFAVCWETTNRDRIESERQTANAHKFFKLFGESAPFLAAAGLAEFSGPLGKLYEPQIVNREDALAFMVHYPMEMNEW